MAIKKTFWICCCLAFLISNNVILSQTSLNRPYYENFTSRLYGNHHSPENWFVTKDNNGVLYAGNSHGLLKFDNHYWSFIDVKKGSNVVSGDISGDKFFVGCVGSFGEIRATENGKQYYYSLSDLLPDSIVTGIIWRTFIINDQTFFQDENGIYSWNGTDLKHIPVSNTIHVSFRVNNELWYRERGAGLNKLSENGSEFIKGSEMFSDVGVFSILYHEQSNQHFIFTRENGIWTLNNGEFQELPLDMETRQILDNSFINGVCLTNDGSFAIYTLKNGVIFLSPKGKYLKTINKNNGINSNEIKHAFIDNADNLWMATSRGVSCVSLADPWSRFEQNSGLTGDVRSSIIHSGYLYSGTTEGLFVCKNGAYFNKLNGISGSVWKLKVIGENLAVGTSEGLFTINPVNDKTQTICSIPSNGFEYNSKTDTWIVSGSEGIFILDSKGNTIKDFKMAPPFTSDVIEDPSNNNSKNQDFWVGIQGSALAKISITSEEISLGFYGQHDGINPMWVQPKVLKNELVFMTSEGLMNFELLENQTFFDFKKVYNHTVTGQILGVESFFDSILVAKNDEIGFLSVQNPTDLNRCNFSSLKLGRINEISYHGDQLIINTSEGLFSRRFNGNENIKKPKVSVYGIWIFGDSLIYSNTSTNELQPIKYENNTVKIKLMSDCFFQRNENKFRWKFSDSQFWNDWNSSPLVELVNIREGKYELQFQTKNIQGIESASQKVSFSILAPWYRSTGALAGYFILFIVFVLGLVKISSHRLKVKNEKLEAVILERTKEIRNKNEELTEQKNKIFHQKKEIEDSINYASRIQRAILPNIEEFHQQADFFILYKPRDVVSGDFYWMHESKDGLIIVCADCTGHGVPGAFMSMIGADKLNQAVVEEHITCPSDILSYVNKGIKKSLKQTGDEDSTRDGMDAAVINYRPGTNVLEYAGANRPIWILSNEELSEFKATKVAIAGLTENDQVFHVNDLQVKPGDCAYLFSDGYPDQFGGPKGKKFKNKTLKELLLSIHTKPMNEQKSILDDTINDWMKGHEQIDDICIIGIRMA